MPLKGKSLLSGTTSCSPAKTSLLANINIGQGERKKRRPVVGNMWPSCSMEILHKLLLANPALCLLWLPGGLACWCVHMRSCCVARPGYQIIACAIVPCLLALPPHNLANKPKHRSPSGRWPWGRRRLGATTHRRRCSQRTPKSAKPASYPCPRYARSRKHSATPGMPAHDHPALQPLTS